MGVTISLPLFGEPGRELGDGAALSARQLRELAASLHERLDAAATMLDALSGAGWTARVALFDAILEHARVFTRAEAERQLRELGLDPEAFIIVEDIDEEDDLQ